ncbi:MAG: AAA family ATPase, partial [Patescibacteria group bacterium]
NYLVAIVLIAVVVWFVFFRSSHKKSASAFGRFSRDLTQMARDGKLEMFSGREAEIERMTHILMRKSKNNPLLIGQPGVGKTAIVEGLADRIARGDVPDGLKDKQVLALDLISIVADTKYRGEMEARLKGMLHDLENVKSHAILFIDEVHMLDQLSGAEGSLNISDVLKPVLARGEVQVIGATTWSEYESTIKKDQPLDRRFQPVIVEEPTPKEALAMLKHVRSAYETFHKVTIEDEALEAAVSLSRKRIKGRYLPDKALDLIDEASAKVAIELSRREHGSPFGIVHAAAKVCENCVTAKDIEEVVNDWVGDGKK